MCSAQRSGVQPSARWMPRTGRDWLIRKISFLRVENTCALTSFAASLNRYTASGALCSAVTCLRCSMRLAVAGSLAGIDAVMRVQATGAMQFERTLNRPMSTAIHFDSATMPSLAAP